MDTSVHNRSLRPRPRKLSATWNPPVEGERNRKRKKEFHCPLCDSKFKQESFFARHMDLHSGLAASCERCKDDGQEKPWSRHCATAGKFSHFSCENCGKSFSQKINLITHMRVHTGERPFKCKKCDAAFKQQSALDNHLRRHSGILPYSCWECNAKFRQRSHLDNHRRRHTGERPYTCDQCDASFIQRSNLNFHMSKHQAKGSNRKRKDRERTTNKELFVCDKCKKSFRRENTLLTHQKLHSGERCSYPESQDQRPSESPVDLHQERPE